MVTKEQLNKLDKGAPLVIYNEAEGRIRALFVRVTRAGKGNDVMIDVPEIVRGRQDYCRKVIPMSDVLSVIKDPKPKAKPPKKRKPLKVEIDAKARAQIAKSINHDWRELAEDAIRQMREVAGDAYDELRAATFRRVAVLERRQATLAGQLEMFT